MNIETLGKAFQFLREMEKQGEGGINVLGRLGEAAKSLDAVGSGMSRALKERGHGTTAIAARVLPHAAVIYAGHKLLSGPIQKVRDWQARRQYEKAVRQQGGY